MSDDPQRVALVAVGKDIRRRDDEVRYIMREIVRARGLSE